MAICKQVSSLMVSKYPIFSWCLLFSLKSVGLCLLESCYSVSSKMSWKLEVSSFISGVRAVVWPVINTKALTGFWAAVDWWRDKKGKMSLTPKLLLQLWFFHILYSLFEKLFVFTVKAYKLGYVVRSKWQSCHPTTCQLCFHGRRCYFYLLYRWQV